jgi:cyclophilin family peptidyl-prolyl cis-trans isomerase
VVRSPAALLALLFVVAFAGCGDDDSDSRKSGLDTSKTYEIEFRTNRGTFAVRLDVRQAPNTTESLVSLARKGFYDGTTFHRVVPGFVIQGGDPTGTGTGGPGYKTVDKPPPTATYEVGVVAMAKAANEPPGTAGSQFFVVSGPNGRSLTPDYAIVGKVIDGMSTVKRIDALGDASDPTGKPRRRVIIQKATVSAS